MIKLEVKSHQCHTTHSACECVLDRLKKLEDVAKAAKVFLNADNFKHECPAAECRFCETQWTQLNWSKDAMREALAKLEGGKK